MAKLDTMKLAAFVGTLLIAQAAGAQISSSRAERVAKLFAQLRWDDEAGYKRYLASRDEVTHALLREVDRFIAESFSSAVSPGDVKDGLDRLFGYKQGMAINNVAFSADLPGGTFLIVGVEIWRGGRAIAENAMSFRAYRHDSDRLTFVGATEDLHGGDATYDALDWLHVRRIDRPPVSSECWFLGWAMVPPRSPYTIAMRAYAFDGEAFRTVWKPLDVVVTSIEAAVDVEPTAFVVNSLFSVDGNPLHATEIKHEQFALTRDGPVVVAEWRTTIQ